MLRFSSFDRRRALAFALLGLSLGVASPVARAKPPAQAKAAPYYDEVFETLPDGTKRVRPYYQKVYEIYSKMSEKEREAFLKHARKDFHGDNALDPLPRLIPRSEYDVLEKGVTQRGTAIRMFLQEYYSGNRGYAAVIPQKVVDRIVARAGETGYKGLVPPSQIAFPYGPDIIRTPDGKWVVLEDNPGYIGGPGDLKKALETLLKEKPEYKDALQIKNDPVDYFKRLVAEARAHANPKNGRIVMYMVPPYPDNEDMRIKDIYKSLGVDIITPRTKAQLQTTRSGVFMRTTGEDGKVTVKKVGYLFLGDEHKVVDPSSPGTWENLLKTEAESHLEEKTLLKKTRKELQEALIPDPATGRLDLVKLKKALRGSNFKAELGKGTHARGVIDAILSNKVPTNYAPGVDFIGDKEFYTYVDDLIRHYLHEEPAVPNLPTERFAKVGADGKSVVDSKLLDDTLKNGNYKKYVIKVVDGRGGDGIFIGPKLKPEELAAIRAKIEAHPDSYIRQPFTHLSVVDDRIVDVRLISTVTPRKVVISKVPWGRGVPESGNGKVNLSQNGREFAVIVVDDDPSGGTGCIAAMKGFIRKATRAQASLRH